MSDHASIRFAWTAQRGEREMVALLLISIDAAEELCIGMFVDLFAYFKSNCIQSGPMICFRLQDMI